MNDDIGRFALLACVSLLVPLSSCAATDATNDDPTQTAESATVGGTPYPASTTITAIDWDFAHEVTLASGSDLWPLTWGADDEVWGGWGDGGGFGGSNSVDRVSIGFAKITGMPPAITGIDVWGSTNPGAGKALHPATFCGKPESAISAGGVLYVWVGSAYNDSAADFVRCPPNPAVTTHRLSSSSDGGATWKEASWTFTENSGAIVFNNFINYGEDNEGAPEGYVYAYGYKIGGTGGNTYLARVPANEVTNESAYRVFTGLDASGAPIWSTSFTTAHAQPVTKAGGDLGATFFHPQSGRYISASFRTGVGSLYMVEAPQPWGPWSTFESETNWGGFGNKGESLALTFPTKWISTDGRTIWGVFSWGDAPGDAFHMLKATLTFGAHHVEVVGLGGKCIDASGTTLAIHTCNGSAGQTFRQNGDTLVNVDAKCLTAVSNVNHGAIDLQTCDGSAAQTWTPKGRELVNGGGRCLDLSHANTTDGTPVIVYDCSPTKTNQMWTLTAVK